MFHKGGGFYRSSAYMRGKRQRTLFIKAAGAVLSFFLIILALGYTGFATVRVNGDAMNPTFIHGERLISAAFPYGIRLGTGNKKYFGFSRPGRGDLVLLRPAYNAEQSRLTSAVDYFLRTVTFQKASLEKILGEGRGDGLVVRRIVGLPGDTVYVEKGWCYIKPSQASTFRREDELVADAYSIDVTGINAGFNSAYPGPSFLPVRVLGDDEFFVLGDNRLVMDDSRFWGEVPGVAVLGKVLISYWPFNQ